MSNEHMPASTDTDKAAFSPDMAERAAARRREFAANRRAASEAWSKQKEAAGEAHREQDWLRLGGEQVDEAKARVEASELRLAYAKDDLMEKYLQHAEGDDASSPDVTVEDVMFEFAFKKSEIEAALSELQDRETRTPLDRERLTARIKAEQIKLDELVGAWHDIGGDAVDKTQEELVIAKAELASSEENVYAAMEARQAPKKEAKEPVVPAEPSPTAPGASNKSGKADKKQPTPQNGTPEPSNEASNESAKEQSPWAEVLDSDELSIEEVRNTLIAFMNSKYESLRQGSDRQDADKFLREVLGMVDGYMHDRKSKKNAEWLEWDNQAKVTNLKNSLADYFKRLMREGNSAGEPGTGEAEQTESEASARSRAQEIIASYIADMKNAPVVSEYAPDADKKNGRQAIYGRAKERAATIKDEEVRQIALELLEQAYAELITTTGVGLGSLEQPNATASGIEASTITPAGKESSPSQPEDEDTDRLAKAKEFVAKTIEEMEVAAKNGDWGQYDSIYRKAINDNYHRDDSEGTWRLVEMLLYAANGRLRPAMGSGEVSTAGAPSNDAGLGIFREPAPEGSEGHLSDSEKLKTQAIIRGHLMSIRRADTKERAEAMHQAAQEWNASNVRFDSQSSLNDAFYEALKERIAELERRERYRKAGRKVLDLAKNAAKGFSEWLGFGVEPLQHKPPRRAADTSAPTTSSSPRRAQ